jgi:hypothetical protein
MTFKDRYDNERRWQSKAAIMDIFHLKMKQHHKKWTIKQTAAYFEVSIGLVSENLKLSKLVADGQTREQALRKIKKHG